MQTDFAFNYKSAKINGSLLVHADCFEWLSRVDDSSLHAIVTDPPYGVKEFEDIELHKRSNGKGVHLENSTQLRRPHSLAASEIHRPNQEREGDASDIFVEWGKLVCRASAQRACFCRVKRISFSRASSLPFPRGGLEFRARNDPSREKRFAAVIAKERRRGVP